MPTMTAPKLADHIKSRKWDKVETFNVGSDRYNEYIGLFRVCFNLEKDPESMKVLSAEEYTQFWTKIQEDEWQRLL